MRKYDRYETAGWRAENWMWAALRTGDLNDVKDIFSKYRPDPDCAEKYDAETPLMFAVGQKDVALAEFLLQQGAAVSSHSGYLQFTALHAAAGLGDDKMVALLLKHKADVNARTRYGETPLHRAAWGGHELAAVALIVAKGDVDAQNDLMQTPLHCAISANRAGIVKVLLEWDADTTKTDLDGQDPQAFAEKLQSMLMGSPNPQLTHLQFMEHARNLEKIFDYLQNADALRDCTNIEHMKGAFNKGAKREIAPLKPIGLKPKPPKTGFLRA
jgi:hypothetical protein